MTVTRLLSMVVRRFPNYLMYKNKRCYTLAITREVPESLADGVSMKPNNDDDDDNNTLSVNVAKEQKAVYVNTLRSILPTIVLPPIHTHPDSVFVEDTVVAVGNTAVINRIGHESRQGEVDDMKHVLLHHDLFGLDNNLDVTDMRLLSEDGTCDGGDVLYPGQGNPEGTFLFVGLSSRTNSEGFRVLQNVFEKKGIRVVPVPNVANDNALHLKSVVTHLDERTIVAPTGPLGDEMLQAMGAEKRGYSTIRLPHLPTCNLVCVNGHILAQETDCQESKDILEQAVAARKLQLHYVQMNEFAKIDGALTCCSILLDV